MNTHPVSRACAEEMVLVALYDLDAPAAYRRKLVRAILDEDLSEAGVRVYLGRARKQVLQEIAARAAERGQ